MPPKRSLNTTLLNESTRSTLTPMRRGPVAAAPVTSQAAWLVKPVTPAPAVKVSSWRSAPVRATDVVSMNTVSPAASGAASVDDCSRGVPDGAGGAAPGVPEKLSDTSIELARTPVPVMTSRYVPGVSEAPSVEVAQPFATPATVSVATRTLLASKTSMLTPIRRGSSAPAVFTSQAAAPENDVTPAPTVKTTVLLRAPGAPVARVFTSRFSLPANGTASVVVELSAVRSTIWVDAAAQGQASAANRAAQDISRFIGPPGFDAAACGGSRSFYFRMPKLVSM